MSVADGHTIVSTPNLPFALAQARATALRGYPFCLHDQADGCVTITVEPDGLALRSTSPIDPLADVHAGEPCHLVVVSEDGDQLPAGNDPQRHAKMGDSELKIVKPARVESEHELERKADRKAMRESAKEQASYLREFLIQRLPKASVTTLGAEAFIRSANQALAKAACDRLGLAAPSVGQDYCGVRAIDSLMRFAETGDAQLQRAGLALAFALARSVWAPRGADRLDRAHQPGPPAFPGSHRLPARRVRGPAPRPDRRPLEEPAKERRRWDDRRAQHQGAGAEALGPGAIDEPA